MSALLLNNAHCIDFHSRQTFRGLLLRHGIIERLYRTPPRSQTGPTMNLHNHYVIPGFTDSHTHLIAHGIDLQRIDLEACQTLDDCLQKLDAASHQASPEVFGSNYDDSMWRSFRHEQLTRATLDRISRKKPVIMRRICGHFAVVNSAALRMIAPTWTIVDRKRGYLYEDVALNLNDIFEPSAMMLEKAVHLGTREALSLGITTVHEIGDIKRFALLQRCKQKHPLSPRFAIYILHRHISEMIHAGISSGFGDDMLKFAGIKIFLDGSLGVRTAALTRFYPGTRKKGMLLMTAHRLARIIRQAEAHGLQLMVHTIGDRTTGHALQAFRTAMIPGNPLRHRLEHLEVLNPTLIRQLARLNIIASMQPNFVRRWQQPGGMYQEYLGRGYRRLNCFGALQRARIKTIFGSDCMAMNPLSGLPAAWQHPLPRCRISRRIAYRMYTHDPAYATFDEHKKGLLKEGFFADLAVLNKHPLTATAAEPIEVMLTFVGGKVVYRNPKYRSAFAITAG